MALRDESRRLIAGLEARYRDDSGVATLKVRHNNVLGYFIETTPTHADKIDIGPDKPFIHRQPLASAVRFTTVELGELEADIGRAADRALALLKALGFHTVEFEAKSSKTARYETVFDVVQGKKPKLPWVVKVANAAKTSLLEDDPIGKAKSSSKKKKKAPARRSRK